MENSLPQPLPAPAPAAEENASPLSTTAPAKPSGRRDAAIALSTAVFYLVFQQIVSRLRAEHMSLVALTTLFSLILTMLFTVTAARALRTASALAGALIVSGALVLPGVLLPILTHMHPTWPIWPRLGPAVDTYVNLFRLIPGSHALWMIVFAVTIGVGISRLVREFKMLLPMAVALASVDLYVVFGPGMVSLALNGNSPVAQIAMKVLMVPLPTAPLKTGAAPMQLAVGFADFLFIALFFACFVKFKIPSRNTFIALCSVLAAYMMIVFFTGTALPALVPIAVVVIGMNIPHFRYERSEAFALLYAGLIVAATAVGFYFYSHHAK